MQTWSERPLPSAVFEVHALGSTDKRGLLFYHEAKQLAGAYIFKPDEEGPVTIRLEPCGTLTGRLVDEGGVPQAGAQLTCDRPYDGGILDSRSGRSHRRSRPRRMAGSGSRASSPA